MNYQTLIKTKKSVREYQQSPLAEAEIKELRGYLNGCKRLVTEIETDIRFLNRDTVYHQLDGAAGYHGILIDAPHYLVILSEQKGPYIENAGYLGEEFCLKAKELNIGSCWITFQSSKTVIEKLNLTTDKEVVGLIAFGKAIEEKKAAPQAAALDISDLVYFDKWGNCASAEQLEERALLSAFQCATLAPSTLNRQPWRFIISKNQVILTVRDDEHTNTYEEKIDAGIVMLYFEAVVSETLFQLNWKLNTIENNYEIPDNYIAVASCQL